MSRGYFSTFQGRKVIKSRLFFFLKNVGILRTRFPLELHFLLHSIHLITLHIDKEKSSQSKVQFPLDPFSLPSVHSLPPSLFQYFHCNIFVHILEEKLIIWFTYVSHNERRWWAKRLRPKKIVGNEKKNNNKGNEQSVDYLVASVLQAV